jgi:hypothetical protein
MSVFRVRPEMINEPNVPIRAPSNQPPLLVKGNRG